MKTKNLYQYPLRKEDVIRIDLSSPAHKGRLKHAVDFLCKEDSWIHATADGEAVHVVNNKKRRTEEDMADAGNFILLKHKNSEYSHYAHLGYKKIKINVGSKVKAGDVIAYSGNTGFSYGPHLHFSVIKFKDENKKDFESLEIRWSKK